MAIRRSRPIVPSLHFETALSSEVSSGQKREIGSQLGIGRLRSLSRWWARVNRGCFVEACAGLLEGRTLLIETSL